MTKKSISSNALKVSLTILLYVCCLQLHPLMAQLKDSKGKEFWLMMPRNWVTSQPAVYITSAYNATGTVSVPGLSFEQAFSVSPNNAATIVLPAEVAMHDYGVVDSKGIHITSNNEISVSGLTSISGSADAYLGLPVDVLGTKYQLSTTWNEETGSSEFGVVATQDLTLLTITPYSSSQGHPGHETYTVVLNKGETYEDIGNEYHKDFSGSTISSSKPVGIINGHQCARIPASNGNCNRLIEMMPPTSAFGRKFLGAPLKGRTNGDTWRIAGSEPYTTVTINGVVQPTIFWGSFIDKVITGNTVIESDKPIMVSQYSNSSAYSGNPGAPFSMIVPPADQYLTDYTVSTAGSYASNYINVMAPTMAIGSITLDGQVVPAASFSVIGKSGYSAAQIEVNPGLHKLHGNLPFGATVYGFDQDRAYGFPAGQMNADVAKIWKFELRKTYDTLNISRQSCYQAVVFDNLGYHALRGVTVMFTVKGKNANVVSYGITDYLGTAYFCYQGALAGNDTVVASVGTIKDSEPMVWLGDSCRLSLQSYVQDATGTMANGSVSYVVEGGTPPYTLQLDNRLQIGSEPGGGFGGIAYGTHTLELRDAKYCATKTQVQVMRKIIPDHDVVRGLPKDMVVRAEELNCQATLNWQEPGSGQQDTINLPAAYNDPHSKLIYKGSYNGHMYYQSTGFYKWPNARLLAEQKGAHLLTVNSEGENDFVHTTLKQGEGYGPWIGLYNTGSPGQFAWVTGEPVYYAPWHWYPGEPNNGGRTDSIAEPYVHIWGYDTQNRWNDLTGLYYLPFIAEFEGPVISYRQVRGPSNGSAVAPGDYDVCYEVINRIENRKDTTCFHIKVECIPGSRAVQGDTTIIAAAGSCSAPLKWTQPVAPWPQQIWIPNTSFALGNFIEYKTLFNGHAYYIATGYALWDTARVYAESVGGHLATINSAAENDMIVSNFKNPGGYGPWIGLYNTGRQNSFAWVTGEPYSYTNWGWMEPNNQNGDAYNIAEPYVLLNNYDNLARWNDIGKDHTATFITEFDSSIYRYKQVSGPAWGAIVDTGTYTICYEVKNTLGKAPGLVCFNIKVACGNVPSIASSPSFRLPANMADEPAAFKATAVPNPSVSNFKVKVASQNTVQRVSMQVVDVSGRVVEVRNNVVPNTIITLGDHYSRGVYFIQVIQGAKREVIKVVKE